MILLTVGTQLPFDRLVRAVDCWSSATGRTDIVGQIGNLDSGAYEPRNFVWSSFLTPKRFEEILAESELVISHAGMGSIISALRYSTPIVIMPRQAALGEHRNDHQVATAARLSRRNGIYVARDETLLPSTLENASKSATNCESLPPFAPSGFTDSLRKFIFDNDN